MKNISLFLLLLCVGTGLLPLPSFAAAPEVTGSPPTSETYYRATVLEVREEGTRETGGVTLPYQRLFVELQSGPEKGRRLIIENGGSFIIREYRALRASDTVVLAHPDPSPQPDFYYIIDTYRLPRVLILIVLFFALALYFARRKGFAALLGMLISAAILFYFIIPQILAGANPLVITIIGAAVILVVSLYVSHGFNRRTSVALVSALATLAIAIVLDLLFVWFAHLTGAGTEEAFYLQFGGVELNLRGVLLSGIIIGVLGVLDDVTTAQSATVEEIARANPALGARELYVRGLSVGREHIISLVNTLFLAYAGASFPLLLLFAINRSTSPLWLTLNSGFLGEEIVRTLVGSSALILAVPITTALAAYWFGKKS